MNFLAAMKRIKKEMNGTVKRKEWGLGCYVYLSDLRIVYVDTIQQWECRDWNFDIKDMLADDWIVSTFKEQAAADKLIKKENEYIINEWVISEREVSNNES